MLRHQKHWSGRLPTLIEEGRLAAAALTSGEEDIERVSNPC